MTDPEQQGGPEWERNQAAKRIAAAVQAGDESGIEEGADRLGDAVVNATASRLIPTLEHTLAVVLANQIRPIGQQFDTLIEQFASIRRDDLALRHATMKRLDALADSHKAIDDRQAEILTAVRDGAARLGKIEVEQARQGAIVDARPAQRAAEKQERLDWQAGIERRIEALEQMRHSHDDNSDAE